MELSNDTIKGLANIQNSNVLNDDLFGKLLEIVITHICEKQDVKNIAQIYGSKPDVVKGAFADLTSLFVEAVRHDYSAEKLNTFLQGVQINGPRVQKLCDTYAKFKGEIETRLGQIGDSLPHIVDVNWRLDYCIKSSTENTIGVSLYHIQLSTKKHDELKYVKFTCTMQQLQELIHKLKDAVRHVEKVANA